ncbi:hypothetical protein D3C83_183900 [compost metagenome]
MIPSNGKARKGTSAVAVSGNAWLIHQIAIRMTMALVRQADSGMPAGAGSISSRTKTARPPHRPQRCAIHFLP